MTISTTAVSRFEVYVLMSMRRWLKQLGHGLAVDARRAERGFSVGDAERIHRDTVAALRDETSQFENLRDLLEIAAGQSDSLAFASVFWPGFDFMARAGGDGRLVVARYCHARGHPPNADTPRDFPLWSRDVADFGKRFGPLTFTARLPVTHEVLPSYESHSFDWAGERYGAAFSWELFLNAAMEWD